MSESFVNTRSPSYSRFGVLGWTNSAPECATLDRVVAARSSWVVTGVVLGADLDFAVSSRRALALIVTFKVRRYVEFVNFGC